MSYKAEVVVRQQDEPGMVSPMEATMTHTSKGELSDLNLTSGQWHYVENASDGGLRQSLGDDNCQGDFAEAIRRELKQRSART